MDFNKKDTSSVGIIANDAGAANLILWLTKNYDNILINTVLMDQQLKFSMII